MQKAKLGFVKVKLLLPTFIVAAALSIPLRIYQYLFIINPETGFYNKLDWSVYALYIVLGVFSLAFIVFSLLSKEAVASKAPDGQSKAVGIVGFGFAVCFVVDAIKQISAFAFAVLGYSGSAVGLTLWKYLTGNGYIPGIFQAVFALGAAVYLIIFGLSYLNGKNTYQDSKLLALNPMLWAVCKMIARLMRPVSYTKLSELLLELFSLAFLMLTFLAFARVSSQLSEKGAMRKVFAYGLPAALFSFVLSIPRLALTLIGQSEMLTDLYTFDVTELGCAVFLVTYIACAMYFGKREVPEEIKEEEEAVEIDDDFLSEE